MKTPLENVNVIAVDFREHQGRVTAMVKPTVFVYAVRRWKYVPNICILLRNLFQTCGVY